MHFWLGERPLVLASKSEARRASLLAAGIPVEVRPADLDERAIESEAGIRDAGEIAVLLARAKAHAVAQELRGRLVLGADQTLALGEKVISKPADRTAAAAQLA